MKNAFGGLPKGLDTTTERVSEPEERWIENSKTEMQKGKNQNSGKEQKIQELWNSYKRCKRCIMEIPERQEISEGR